MTNDTKHLTTQALPKNNPTHLKLIPLLIIACFGSSQSFGQTGALSLSSTSGNPGATVSLNLNLTNGGGPDALGWTLTYSTTDLASVTLAAGSSATGAGKSLQCNPAAG